MKLILELYDISSFHPEAGYSQELLNLFLEGGSRKDAIKLWKEVGRSQESFRHAIKRLKDNLLREASFSTDELSEIQRKRIECWEKFYKVKALLIADKKSASIGIATETIRQSIKCGFSEITMSLASVLENHYAAIESDTRKYLRYRKIKKEAVYNYTQEMHARALHSKLIFYYLKKKKINNLEQEIIELLKIKCTSPYFMEFRTGVLTSWYHLNDDFESYEQVLLESAEYFESTNHFIGFSALTSMYKKLALLLMAKKKFDGAEKFILRALKLPRKGSYTDNLLLQLKAILGIHSNKPQIALEAWKRASKFTDKPSPRTKELWLIIRAYLEIYNKLGAIYISGEFKINKFLNSLQLTEQDKKGVNISIKVVAFLLHLLNGRKNEYMLMAEGVSAYTHNHLRKKENIRKRSILFMLRKVEEADYKKLRTELRVGRWKKNLRDNPLQIVDFSEIMPYEKVWEIVLTQLK